MIEEGRNTTAMNALGYIEQQLKGVEEAMEFLLESSKHANKIVMAPEGRQHGETLKMDVGYAVAAFHAHREALKAQKNEILNSLSAPLAEKY